MKVKGKLETEQMESVEAWMSHLFKETSEKK